MASGLKTFMTEHLRTLLWTSPKKYTTDSTFMLHTEMSSFSPHMPWMHWGIGEISPLHTTKNIHKLISFHDKYTAKK